MRKCPGLVKKSVFLDFGPVYCYILFIVIYNHQVPDLYIYDLKNYKNRETVRPQIGVSLKKQSENLGKYQDQILSLLS